MKTFEELVKEKATCLEFAMNGFLRIYEEGEKRCECQSCFFLQKEKEKNLRQDEKK